MNQWTLERQRVPVTLTALEDTIPEPEFSYHDVQLRYTDSTSHSSFESQTAKLQFKRAGSMGSMWSSLGRTPSVRSSAGILARTPSTRSNGRVVRGDELGEGGSLARTPSTRNNGRVVRGDELGEGGSLARTPSTRSSGRVVRGHHGGSLVRTPSTRSQGRVAREDQLGDVKKQDLAEMLEKGISTFKS